MACRDAGSRQQLSVCHRQATGPVRLHGNGVSRACRRLVPATPLGLGNSTRKFVERRHLEPGLVAEWRGRTIEVREEHALRRVDHLVRTNFWEREKHDHSVRLTVGHERGVLLHEVTALQVTAQLGDVKVAARRGIPLEDRDNRDRADRDGKVAGPELSLWYRHDMDTGTQIAARLDSATIEFLDHLVADGRFESRAAAVRFALDRFRDVEERRATGQAIAEGYRRVPQADQDVDVAEANLRRLVAEESW